MAHVDEARTWPEQPMEAGELRRLLIAVKAALEEHGDRLAPGDLADFAIIDEAADALWHAA